MAEYPKRESHFAHKFTRLVFRCCLANEIGPEACYMLIQIVHTEDAAHYRKAVTFFNEQLINVCGFSNVKSLDRARKKAIEHGWLNYSPGAKSKPGRYFVTIPEHAVGLPDGSVESDFHTGYLVENDQGNISSPQNIIGKNDQASGREAGSIREVSGREAGDKRATFIPTPIPAPKNIEITQTTEKPKQRKLDLPERVNSERNQKQLFDWLMVRLNQTTNGEQRKPIPLASWEAILMSRADWDEPRWFRALLKSTEAASKHLIDPPPERIDPDDPNNWPEGQTCRARVLTAEEIKNFTWGDGK